MKRSARFLVLAVCGGSLFLNTGCTKLRARDQLNRGVQSYKGAKYEEAINHFQQAINLDPKLYVARLYLATAYLNQFIPGSNAPDNLKIGNEAIDEFKQVLADDPNNKTNSVQSLKGIASIYFNMNKMQDAKQYQQKVLELDPNDPEAYYSVGVINWTLAYKNSKESHAAVGQSSPEEAFREKSDCLALKQKNGDLVNEGIDNLSKAITVRQDYDDAMAYLNLLYRRKADIECDDPGARKSDLNTADDWSTKTMATKKARAEKEAQKGNGIVLDDSK